MSAYDELLRKKIDALQNENARLYIALENLFQACAGLCLDDMNKLEAVINEAAEALKKGKSE